jgi:hypothetical protein
MSVRLEIVLVGGERRLLRPTSHTGTVGNYLSRLDDWIETEGGWVQKCHIVEVRTLPPDGEEGSGSAEELRQLDEAAGRLADARLSDRQGDG